MKFNEFAIVEKKKRRKRKPRWAAYGPGPFGGYGFATGYSGAGGVSGGDGGVGEASYEGNIGMMEVAKFFKVANQAQKKLFKELLEKGKRGLAWKLIQDVTDTKLQGKEFEVDEGWRDTLAGLALGGAVAMGGAQAKGVDTGEKYHGYSEPIQLIQKVEKGDTVYSLAREFGVSPEDIRRANKLDKNFTIKPGQELGIPKKSKAKEFQYKEPEKRDKPIPSGKTLTGTATEMQLMQGLLKNGIKGIELAAFMAQSALETGNYRSLIEEGSKRYFLRYDKTSKNPDHRKTAKRLGNTEPGDGAKFKGRGYLQITGRWNYGAVGKLIGKDLINNPELLENPEIAIQADIAFWKMRVRPNVSNFNDVRAVTRPINKGLDKLSVRKKNFKEYKTLLALR